MLHTRINKKPEKPECLYMQKMKWKSSIGIVCSSVLLCIVVEKLSQRIYRIFHGLEAFSFVCDFVDDLKSLI